MLTLRRSVASFGAILSLLFILSVSAKAAEHPDEDYIDDYFGLGLTQIIFSAVPDSVVRTVVVPAGGRDVEIFLQDCCIRDDVVEVYVDDCFIARVDSQGGDFGTHPGERHTVSLEEGPHTIEYRNVFSLIGPSGWFVSETLKSFTGAFPPCSIEDILLICRPLVSPLDDELLLTSKMGRHCYFTAFDSLGNKSTYGAYNKKGILSPQKNDTSDLNHIIECTVLAALEIDFSTDACQIVEPRGNQTLDSIVAHLEAKVKEGPQGNYNVVWNNSNEWIEDRIKELKLKNTLPAGAINSLTDLRGFWIPIVEARWVACGAGELTDLLFCRTLGLCEGG